MLTGQPPSLVILHNFGNVSEINLGFVTSNACFLHYKFNKKFITRILDFCLRLMFYNISCYCVLFLFNETQYWILTGTQLSYQTKRSLRIKIHKKQIFKIFISAFTQQTDKNSVYSYQGNFHLFYDFLSLSHIRQDLLEAITQLSGLWLLLNGRRQIIGNFSTHY